MQSTSRRCSRAEKTEFLTQALPELEALGYECALMQGRSLGLLSQDLAAGSVSRARYILTAHYDTPRISLLPLRVYPAGTLKSLLCAAPFLLLPFAAALVVSRVTGGGAYTGGALFLLLLTAMLGVAPAAQSRDTGDSGIEAMLEAARALPAQKRQETALVLTDNRHLFGLGAALLAPLLRPDATVIGFEGVGRGERLLACSKNPALAEKFIGAAPSRCALRLDRAEERMYKSCVLLTAVDARGGRTMGRNEPAADAQLIKQAAKCAADFILNN